MPRLMAAWGSLRDVGSPRQVMVPASGWWAPARVLIRVDFPAPFWPSRQCTSPARTSRSTPSRARTPGNCLTIPRITRRGAESVDGSGMGGLRGSLRLNLDGDFAGNSIEGDDWDPA